MQIVHVIMFRNKATVKSPTAGDCQECLGMIDALDYELTVMYSETFYGTKFFMTWTFNYPIWDIRN